MFGTVLKKNLKPQQPKPYATRADFCRIFQEDMDRLYLLSLLLTGDHTLAEKCFVGGLRISREGNHVFKEWAHSWARRAIILNAIRMIRPRLDAGNSSQASPSEAGNTQTEKPEIADIITLPAFDRFVFVMSVLERYSDHECSLLLTCTRADMIAARTRALQQIGGAAYLRDKIVTIDARTSAMPNFRAPQLRPEAFSPLAASA